MNFNSCLSHGCGYSCSEGRFKITAWEGCENGEVLHVSQIASGTGWPSTAMNTADSLLLNK